MYRDYQASLLNLHEMLICIRDSALSLGFDAESLHKIELASEEVLVNIIKHGFLNKIGTITIFCESFEGQGIKIIIQDDGIPFNPLEIQQMMQESELEFGTGGFGIMIILNAMDQVKYSRVDNRNSLTLVKLFEEKKVIRE